MQSCELLTGQLTDLLNLLGQTMDSLQQSMASNRTAFVAIDAKRLNAGLRELEPHWQTLEVLEKRRTDLATALGDALGLGGGLEGGPGGTLRVSRIIAAMPRRTAGPLRQAADRADAAARRVRAETNAGARLLGVSREVNEETIRSLTGASSEQAESYDANANRVGAGSKNGRLVIGTA